MTEQTNNRVPAWLWETPIAHRGLHVLPEVPENSLAAFDAAAGAGYAIELDVRLLQSGEVVVFHDADLHRMTGRAGIVEETNAAAIVPLRLGQTSEPIPLLVDVLQVVAGRVPLLVELKSDTTQMVGALENAVLQTLAGYNEAVALQSFRRETVTYLIGHAPEGMACGQLAVSDAWYADGDNGAGETVPHFLGYAVSVLPTLITAALRENGGPVLAWTVQTPEQQKLVAPYADNLIFENFNPITKGNPQ